MHHAKLSSIPWDELTSPSRRFQSRVQNISLALGGQRNVGPPGGGHPFDVQIRRVPVGASVCPYHQHFAQWEMFVVQAGSATVRTHDGVFEVPAGSVFLHPPQTPHQLTNRGPQELEVLIIADNPLLDACYYPDSNKWFLRPPGKCFRMTEVDYFDGEEPASTEAGTFRLSTPPAPLAPLPFAKRHIHPDQLPWEPWVSPQQKFRGASKEISIALGAKRNTPPGLGGHPFDLELSRLEPGECGCPFHRHAAEWEMFLILSGTARVRTDAETRLLGPGEVCLHPPGEAHQITNASEHEALQFWLIADNAPVEYWHYPDSGKWGLREPRKFFRMAEAEYWDGEEPPR